ncbi:MAG: RNA polymerase sigma factor [Steroidobacteraceae bacterium]
MFATLRCPFDPVTLPAGSLLMLEQRNPVMAKERVLDQSQSVGHVQRLDQFLASVERRAFQIARMALRDDDEALDIVQDAMLKLARSYAMRPSEEWRPLFYRILNNRIRDWQRRRTVRNKLFGWLPGLQHDRAEDSDPYEAVPDPQQGPGERVMLGDAMVLLEQALAELPQRQREAFALRNFEGLDVAATALAMGCTEGSVKTHYSRAVHTLRARLGEAW